MGGGLSNVDVELHETLGARTRSVPARERTRGARPAFRVGLLTELAHTSCPVSTVLLRDEIPERLTELHLVLNLAEELKACAPRE